MWHAYFHRGDPEHPESLRWQIVSDEASELSLRGGFDPARDLSRCLLCLPYVGDARVQFDMIFHLEDV